MAPLVRHPAGPCVAPQPTSLLAAFQLPPALVPSPSPIPQLTVLRAHHPHAQPRPAIAGQFALPEYIALSMFLQSAGAVFRAFDPSGSGRITVDFNQVGEGCVADGVGWR